MKKILIFLLTFLLVSPILNAQDWIGKKVSDIPGLVLTDSVVNLLISPASVCEATIAMKDSVYYELCLGNDTINYVSTADVNFRTKEGVRVGDLFGHLIKKGGFKKEQVIHLPGWGKLICLSSGWCAVFHFSDKITANSKILFFYQGEYRPALPIIL